MVLNILLLVAFAALVAIGITAWQCMKLTRGEADSPEVLQKWLKALVASLVALVVFGGGYLLLGALL